jgi:hypothetical protein
MSLSLFSNLPQEIVLHILRFDASIKYRNGEFIDQISPDDSRRKLLLKIPPTLIGLTYDNLPHYYYRDLQSYQLILVPHYNYTPIKYTVVFSRYDGNPYTPQSKWVLQ